MTLPPADPGGAPAPKLLAVVALEAARAAAAVHRRSLGAVATADVRVKGIFDFVSAVDLEAQEAALRDPGAGLPGAPGPGRGGGLGGRDPLGGTAPSGSWTPSTGPRTSSTGTLPSAHRWGSSPGDVPWRGRWWPPPVDRAWVGWEGGGAWEAPAGTPLLAADPSDTPAPSGWSRVRTSEATDLRSALVGTGFPFKRPEEIPGYLEELGRMLRTSSGVRREGSAALDLCRLASGSLDAFWEGYAGSPGTWPGGSPSSGRPGGRWSGPDGAPYAVARGGPLRAANGSGLLEALHRALQEPVPGPGQGPG
jgi:fructose-1,6-bisphosphatase/inositol monophosphatase family enzyme